MIVKTCHLAGPVFHCFYIVLFLRIKDRKISFLVFVMRKKHFAFWASNLGPVLLLLIFHASGSIWTHITLYQPKKE